MHIVSHRPERRATLWLFKLHHYRVFGCGAKGSPDLPTEVWIHGHFPLVEQPLWYVVPIPVALAPPAQLRGTGTSFLRESQLANLHFELSSGSGAALRQYFHAMSAMGNRW